MHVRAADPRAVHVDEHVVDADLGLGHVLQPKARFAFSFNQCFHKIFLV
jgi:hypothetical protein